MQVAKAPKPITRARLHSPAERGFSMPEVVAAAGIIITMVAAFTFFMMNVSTASNSSRLELLASRVMAEELERVSADSWKNLCGFNNTGEVRTVDGLDVTITRGVTWAEDGANVPCTAAAEERDQLKLVSIQVQYQDPQRESCAVDNGVCSLTSSVFKSQHG